MKTWLRGGGAEARQRGQGNINEFADGRGEKIIKQREFISISYKHFLLFSVFIGCPAFA